MILTVTPNPCVHKTVAYCEPPDDRVVVRPVETRYQGGGKGINAARAARALGHDVLALTTWGGIVGRLLLEGLAAEGIPCEAVEVGRPTRMSTFLYERETGRIREYLEGGAPLDAPEVLRLQERFLAVLPHADVVTLNGSTAGHALDRFYAWAVAQARAAGRRAIVDTYGPPAVPAALARPYMVKANLDEIGSSFGVDVSRPGAADDFARSLLDQGIEWVLLTNGKSGAWLHARHGRCGVRAPRVREINPVGSGDAMLGAVAGGIDAGLDLVEAVRVGAAAGAANAARLGVCDFTLEEVEALLPQVEVVRLG
ncbi:MAG: bifunctional hydroxymethylpyrimidine kinase/phosphomethylpyrimidine kinase [Planctomycetes bacterium]|nr:bifunctional hydroxymethylpyrimidine kinase/phosphomethylpyrimidine kinase [Planctomycetota bacterium]